MRVRLHSVTDDEADLRLDRWFRRHHPELSQGAVQKLCRTGQIRLDGKRVTAATRLSPGLSLRIPPLPVVEARPESQSRGLDPRLVREVQKMILYQDEQVIILDKPSGLATQGGAGITRHVDMMLDGVKGDATERPRLVHRLDRDTSGILLVARTPGVAAKLAESFRHHEVEKIYWAIVVGRPHPTSGVIDQPLAKLGSGNGALVIATSRDDADALVAKTDYEVIDCAGKKFSWLAMKPLTGRTHQLRVHCETLGTPILGDAKYGGQRAHPLGFTDQLHLHARSLTFPHPGGGFLKVVSPPPAHMRETFKQLGFVAEPTSPPLRTAQKEDRR